MIHINGISYEIAGRSLFHNLKFTFNSGVKYGLVGPNGVGKSTLLRLIMGELQPDSGHISKDGNILHLAQSESASSLPVTEYLADIWEQHSDCASQIVSLLENIDPGRNLQELSGGEWMKVRLAKALSLAPQFIILDEPTNNLDLSGREIVVDFVKDYSGGLLLVSHDRALLEEVDEILELSSLGISSYRGNFSFYWEQRTAERERQAQHLETSKKEERKARTERLEKLERQEKRMRKGAKDGDSGSLPRILLGGRKRQAQVTQGKIQALESERLSAREIETRKAWEQTKLDPFLRFDFTAKKPNNNKTHFSVQDFNFRFSAAEENLWSENLNFHIRGSERWLIRGPNGSGKSTLLKLLLQKNLSGFLSGHIHKGLSPISFLDQKYGDLNPEQSLLENILESSRFSGVELRNELAFFGFTGDSVLQKTKTLSGGELLKASLAKALLGPDLPEVMILDEPTNNLDFNSQELLLKALLKFQGALVVVSHDLSFIEELGITNEINLS